MTDFYPAAISGETALAGSIICDSWFDAAEWAPECEALAGRDPEVFATAASEVLYLASGSRWPGICSLEVRPCSGLCGCWLAGDYCSACALPCDTARLPTPVHELSVVTIDGVDLDAAEYRLINGEYLKRVSGAWPAQDLAAAAGEANTWTVSLLYGAQPPVLGILAAKALACWIAGADPSSACMLPANVQALSRQGISQQFDPQMRGGFTLPSVALFTDAYAHATAEVWSPDLAPLPPEVL
jgi:hypothetical protein